MIDARLPVKVKSLVQYVDQVRFGGCCQVRDGHATAFGLMRPAVPAADYHGGSEDDMDAVLSADDRGDVSGRLAGLFVGRLLPRAAVIGGRLEATGVRGQHDVDHVRAALLFDLDANLVGGSVSSAYSAVASCWTVRRIGDSALLGRHWPDAAAVALGSE